MITKEVLNLITTDSPTAEARIIGSDDYPELYGRMFFWQLTEGVLITTEVDGLPQENTDSCAQPFFALHIHEGNRCAGNEEDPFAMVGSHYNPHDCAHPGHAGDLPPLLSNQGRAWSAVIDNRFRLSEVIGRTVVIHGNRDDFTSQPAGDSGTKIACGIIRTSWGRHPGCSFPWVAPAKIVR